MKTLVYKSSLAGALIALAGWIFLQAPNKIIGALLFSLGLIAVLILEANLFTGKIGYVNTKQKLLDSLIMLGVNLAVAFVIGLIYRLCNGEALAMATRLSKTWYEIFFDGIGCGACIYIAVESYKTTKSFVPVVLCVMAFILGGFEHCIADMFYFAAGAMTWQGLGYIGIVILGNSIGSLLIRFLQNSKLLENNIV